MNEPRVGQANAAADPGLEVRPEVIKDLDVTGDDADDIAGCGSVAGSRTPRPA